MAEKTTDKLTGLPTQQTFLNDLRDGMVKAGTDETPLSLALVDIDCFDEINRTHGMAVGDEVLTCSASHLQEHSEGKGVVYRCGGDEFAVIMPGIEKEEAFLLAEQMRSTFDAQNPRTFTTGETTESLSPTLSAGIATHPGDGERVDDLLRVIEDAVHRAKETGRNKAALAREEKMVTKTSHYTQGQLHRLATLAKREGVGEAVLLREGLDDLLRKYFMGVECCVHPAQARHTTAEGCCGDTAQSRRAVENCCGDTAHSDCCEHTHASEGKTCC